MCAYDREARSREATARYRAFTLYRTACGSSSSSAIFREKRAAGEIPPHRGPCHAHTCVPVGARRTAAAESEKRRARRTGERAMRRGDSERSAFRVESRENRPRKINDARETASAARDSLPLPPANDSRVINRSGGESFSVEKYRISRVRDARYPVITKFPTSFPTMICA